MPEGWRSMLRHCSGRAPGLRGRSRWRNYEIVASALEEQFAAVLEGLQLAGELNEFLLLLGG